MRSRNIKPGFFRNENLADLPLAARMLFIGLWCIADRRGMLENRPRKIAAEIFPYEPEIAITVNSLLSHCERAGFIRYLTDGSQEYIYIPTFLKHQSPHHTEKDSGFPPPENCQPRGENANHGELTVSAPSVHDGNPPDSLIPDSLIHVEAKPSTTSRPNAFDRFWQAYPRRKAKGAAVKAWERIKPDEQLVCTIIEAIAAQIDERERRIAIAGDAPDWKHPATWLNAQCWTDEIMTDEQIRVTVRKPYPSQPNGTTNAYTGKRNFCPDADTDAELRRALGLSAA